MKIDINRLYILFLLPFLKQHNSVVSVQVFMELRPEVSEWTYLSR